MAQEDEMKVLVACEFSGIVREAFKAKGHDAWSCDLLPSEIPGQHIQDDVIKHLNNGWDALVGFPPCPRRCNSSVRWLINNPERIELLRLDDLFFYSLWNAPIKKICLENPIVHKYTTVPKYSQIIQPWQFGHGETKATCLWLKGLPKLISSNVVEGREARVHKEPPSPDRWKNRSRTYKGIAEAMADQWG